MTYEFYSKINYVRAVKKSQYLCIQITDYVKISEINLFTILNSQSNGCKMFASHKLVFPTSRQGRTWHKAGFYLGQFRDRMLKQNFLVNTAYTRSGLSTYPDEILASSGFFSVRSSTSAASFAANYLTQSRGYI